MGTQIDDGVVQKNGVGDSSVIDRDDILEPKHKVFLSHSGAQKDFVEQLCVDLETYDRYPFFDKRRSSLPIGKRFPKLIFDAIQQCQVGVLVLSEEFFTKTKWPMIELAAMVKELEQPGSTMKIIPVFYHISREEYLDISKRKQWVSQWEEWAREDKRISVEEWKRALEVLKPINSLVMTGIGDVNARKEIVSAVCELVLPETRFDDSHIEGRLRICEILCNKINEDRDGVRVIGLYGTAGIGKTTICKAMCNELFQEFHGRVCHAELKTGSKVELMREVLKTVTNTRHELLDGLKIDLCYDQLRRNIKPEAVFLAIDNVTDDPEFIGQAKTYLGARWAKGSVIIVTARSLDNLLLLHQYIDAHNCIEMPGLAAREARSLFLQHVTCGRDDTTQMDEELVGGCVDRCYFSKGEGKGRHYIPLALTVLGEQLGCNGYDVEQWKAQLRKIDAFDLEFSGTEHPIFSILRTSFDSLSDKAQMLFMDVALFLPRHWPLGFTYYDWLSMVHGFHIDETKRQLEGLKRKSLLESRLGGGYVMHDLWCEFCVAETKRGSFGERRWVWLEEASSELGEVSPPGRCWEHLRRMCFLNEGWRGLDGLHLEDFLNVTVLKIEIGSFQPRANIELDLRGLEHLKSLEVQAPDFKTKRVGLGSLRNLVFLSWDSRPRGSSPCCEEIGRLTKLQALKWWYSCCDKSPDMSMMTSLRVASVKHGGKVVRGLSSKLSNLRFLSLEWCEKLEECPGLGELYSLEELSLSGCYKLKEVPCLRLLTKLRRLDIRFCRELRVVPGLSDLVALEGLLAFECNKLGSLPDMRNLTKLERLECSALSEMDVLDLGRFPELRVAKIHSCTALKSVTCHQPLCELTTLLLEVCSSLVEVPDLRNFPKLKILRLCGCTALMRLTSSVPLPELEILDLLGCSSLNALPDHLSGSVGLRELCLQQSGIVLSGEDIRELEALCKSLKVFPSFSKSMYGKEYVHCTDIPSADSGSAEWDDMVIHLQDGWRSRRLPVPVPISKVTSFAYSNDGNFVMGLTSDGVHKRWDWENEATVSVAPQLWRADVGERMVSLNTGVFIREEVVPCMAIGGGSDWSTVVSASVGEVSILHMQGSMLGARIIRTPSPATAVAILLRGHNIVAIGMEDSTIQIYEDMYRSGDFQAICTLKGHQKRITGLAFSDRLNELVSLGADSHLCVWKVGEWSERQSRFGQLQPDRRTACVGDIRVQFRNDERGLLVIGKSQLVVYDVLDLGRPFAKWAPQSPFAGAITDAIYSCDGDCVYACFVDGSMAVLSAQDLQPLMRLAPPIHPPRGVSASTESYPLRIVAHPKKPRQVALGMSDGSVIVVELRRVPADKVSGSRRGTIISTCSAPVVEATSRGDERDEEPRIPDGNVARCGFLDYCSYAFFTSAVCGCCGSFREVTGADTGIDDLDDIEINMQAKYQSRRLPDTVAQHEVTKLIYSNSGESLVALTSFGVLMRWDWRNEAAVSVAPHLWYPDKAAVVVSNVNENCPGEVVSCMALFSDSRHMISASGEVSVFQELGTEVSNTSIRTPSAATSLAFHPYEEHIIVVGMADSRIEIYDDRLREVVCTLEGHQKRITGLAFSTAFNVLVSLGADNQLCVWKVEEWSKRQSKSGPLQPDRRTSCVGDIRVQFRDDERGLLVVGESQLAIYDVLMLDIVVFQWAPQDPFTAAIVDASFSCDGERVRAVFADGSIGVTCDQCLWPCIRFPPPIHSPRGDSGSTPYPLAIATHPKKPAQIALGMSDGSVIIVEPWQAPTDNDLESGESSGSSAVPQEELRPNEREEEPRSLGSSQLRRCGCLDYLFSFFPTR